MVGAEKAFNCPIISGLLSASAMYVGNSYFVAIFSTIGLSTVQTLQFCCQKTACRRLSVIFSSNSSNVVTYSTE